MTTREFDIIVYGASGYTGRLVAEYLQREYGAANRPRWAAAGRSPDKTRAALAEAGVPAALPVIAADADDPSSIAAMAARTRCVLTTVGPYQIYGEPLIAACIASGTDYVDLCGEPVWMRRMIDKHEKAAIAAGARIVFSCGFDSIPFDLGVWFLQREALKEFAAPAVNVKGLVRAMKGKFSGGTAASLNATMADAMRDPSVIGLLKDPYALAPGFGGVQQPNGTKPLFDEETGWHLAPFIMAPINTKNVHRSNALLGALYGADFRYSEMMVAGEGEKGEAMAKMIAGANPLAGPDAPKPGEGPTKEERETGYYDILFIGETARGEKIRASVRGDRDPGYGSTSKMIAEAAIALIDEAREVRGGVWTPAAAMAAPLLKRLEAHAGLKFARE